MRCEHVEELEILESVESGEWQSIADLSQEIERYQIYAQAEVNSKGDSDAEKLRGDL